MMQPLPLDTSDFTWIRQKGQKYVDKTGYLHQLITDSNCHVFFLSRPRRFGKSLMITMLKAIFQGKRELFDGLSISGTDYDWEVHPVIHLNMGFCASEDYDSFMISLGVEMQRALEDAGYAYDDRLPPADNFSKAVDWLDKQGAAPVILVDEYDDPVAKTLKNIEMAEKVRNHLATI